MKTPFEKMIAGELYNGADPTLLEMQAKAQARLDALNAVSPDDRPAQLAAMRALFGTVDGPCIIKPPFTVEFGCNIHLGAWVFVNNGATFLDSAPITIGERAAIGPNVQLVTATHPVRPADRFTDTNPEGMPPFIVHNIAKPITIGAYAWIGAGAIIMPGVTIGAGAVVGAGSVVTRDVPDRMIAAGNPAKIIRSVDD
ncbi:sugar O-acetyltransferase [Yoonia litorea]|uniref:Nodulation protein L n=1 Tax=Yoonia litorea TaxID=1123755 RepID=A0A1I6MFR1_9RHOB|nr:sugar O-acetyltransferase [Yoonia litorea]SFS14565.1 maltose O-acetyltransferase [Yoonia litorea]